MKKMLWVLMFGVARLCGAATPGIPNSFPCISDIPSPVIGNNNTTASGQFVYPDVMDLNLLFSDDVTTPGGLRWSYTTIGTPHYRINGVAPIDPLTTDPTNPPVAAQINKTVAGGELNPDGKANTITIRNQALSPLGGSTTTPTATGVLAAETQPVTFFCSDGNTYTSQTVFFFTDNGGTNRLSGTDPFRPVNPGAPVDKITKFWRAREWNALGQTGTNFTLTTSTVPGVGTGICMVNGLRGVNWGALASAYPYFNLAANQVYRIRLKMVSSQATGGKTPFWNFMLENYDDLISNGTLNLYVFGTNFYDVQGGANAVLATPATVTLYWAPPAISTTQWNDASQGAFMSARDKGNDPRLRFRTIDVDGYAEGELRSGNLCIQEIEVASAPLTRCQTVGTPLVNITNFVNSTAAVRGNVTYTSLYTGGSYASFSNGTVTVAPLDPPGSFDGRAYEMGTLGPTTDNRFDGNPAQTYNADEYPILWKTGQLLRMQVDMNAPTRYDEDNPWDAFCFLLLSFTNEVNTESYITSNQKCGSPRTGMTSTYTNFFSTHNETQSPEVGFHRLRWEVRFLNTQTINFPIGQKLNGGSIRVSRIKVDEVEFK